VWISTDASAPPGTLRVFLSDGTLLMGSCGETYRLSRWQAIDDRRIEWREDTARIEADIIELTAEHLHLRLRLVDGFKNEAHRLAPVPFGAAVTCHSPAPSTRPATLATVATSSDGSTGFDTCT
jgi:hypothetical protein